MKLSDVVEITVSTNVRTPTQQGFGTPLCLAYHTLFAEDWRLYSDIDGLEADGATSTMPIWRMVNAAFSQDPHPENVMAGRLPAAHVHTQTLKMTSAVEGKHVKFDVLPPGSNTWTTIDYTILAAATTSTVATAVELLVEAVTGVTSDATTDTITVTPDTSGNVIYIRGPGGVGPPVNCELKETTADANYDDQLGVIYGQTKAFYGISLDTNSKANVDLVAAWAESHLVLFGYQTSDTIEKSASVLASGLKAGTRKRTIGKYTDDLTTYSMLGWMALAFAKPPGSINWMFKSVSGDVPPVLNETQETYLGTVNLNFSVTLSGLTYEQNGKCASGIFVDIVHGTDALTVRIQEKLLGDLVNADKLFYDDADIDGVCGSVLSVMRQFENIKFLKPGSSVCTAPKADDISDTDKGLRVLPNVKFYAKLGGAFNKFKLIGTLAN